MASEGHVLSSQKAEIFFRAGPNKFSTEDAEDGSEDEDVKEHIYPEQFRVKK